ncbi:hypothetical protein N7489_009571 [Penicillium chrysogenum]|uniref:uncharacterized protein n=1 Tax=Penicillium chrysogenum TaxID=5076 RepID=UPI0024DF11E5|nr:uncharacterized protein N7489_009571 [Penicillium chrysogenum]KAJ5228863.1 hypothetical protein N7489_009571 [Penicillium chrysogenum]
MSTVHHGHLPSYCDEYFQSCVRSSYQSIIIQSIIQSMIQSNHATKPPNQSFIQTIRSSYQSTRRSPTTSLTVAGFGFRTIGRLASQYSSVSTSITHYQSDRGELRLQDNRQTGQSIYPNPPPRSPPRSTMIHHSQSDRGGRRLQDNRQTGQSIHPNPPPRSPPRSTMIHHSQSDRGGRRLQDNRQTGHEITHYYLTAAGFGFRTIGSLFDSTNHPDQPPYLTTSINLGTPFNHFQSDRGGLRLQDNRQAGQSIHFNQIKSTNPFDYHSGQLSIPIIPLHQPTSSLTVAVFGYTTVGTLVNKSTSINHFQPHRVGPLGLRKNGRLVWSTIHLNKSTSTNPRQQTTSSLTMAGFAFRTIGRLV